MMGMKQFRLVFLALSLSGISLWLPAQTIQRAAGENAPTEAVHISLNGSWKLFYFPQGKYPIANPEQLKTAGLTPIEASVPGEAPLDLSRQGVLPADLFFAENLKKLRPYELYEWWYQREFPTPSGIAGHRLELRFHAVDCLASYWLNGKKLGESADAMVEQSFDVTGMLNAAGPNVLTVRLGSPIVEAAGKTYDPAYTINAGKTNQEAIWIRRPAHSYGWDIMPRAVSAGLWRPVELIVHARHEITDMYFTTLDVHAGRARVAISYELSTDLALLPQLKLRVEGHCGASTFIADHKLEFTAGRFAVELQNPELWWPRGYGDPHLYQVTTELLQK